MGALFENSLTPLEPVATGVLVVVPTGVPPLEFRYMEVLADVQAGGRALELVRAGVP